MLSRRSAILGITSLVPGLSAASEQYDTSYAPQFLIGANPANVSDFFFSFTCPYSLKEFRSKVLPFLKSKVSAGSFSLMFHNVVRNDKDLDYSNDVLNIAGDKYGAFSIAMLMYGAKNDEALPRKHIGPFMRHLGYARRRDFSKDKGRTALALMNAYARENLKIDETPTYFRDGKRSRTL
jgi:hypothetical protein